MARFSRRQFGFTNGEMSPLLHGRADMDAYFAGLAECVNWVPDHKGNLHRRPGTQFIKEAKGGKPCLIDFVANEDCPTIVVADENCFRFIVEDGVVQSDGAPLEIAHTYGADYCDLEYTQDCDVLFLVHENHPPAFLEKTDDGFALSLFTSLPFDALNGDEGCTLTLAAGEVLGVNAAIMRGLPCTLGEVVDFGSFTATVSEVLGANVCRVTTSNAAEAGVFDLADESGSAIFSLSKAELRATGCKPFTADMVGQQVQILDEAGFIDEDNDDEVIREPNTFVTVTIVEHINRQLACVAWDGEEIAATDLFRPPLGEYPETVWLHDDRLWFGYGNAVTGSKTGDFFDWSPVDDNGTVNPDNAIYKKLSNGHCAEARWFQTMGRQLVVGAKYGIHSILGAGVSGAFQADATAQQQNQNIGAADIRPVQVGESIFFVDRSREKLYSTTFTQQYDQLGVNEMTLYADHIGDCKFKRLAYQENPYSIVWAVTEDDKLVSLTTVPSQAVKGWARHELGGSLISNGCCLPPRVCDVASIPSVDEGEDQVYLVVERTIGGVTGFYIEKIGRFFDFKSLHREAEFLDCSLAFCDAVDVAGGLFDGGPMGGASSLPSGRYSVSDGERWQLFDVADGLADLRETAEAPIRHGQDWLYDQDDCSAVKAEKPAPCDEPEFFGENLLIYRPPCRIEKVANCVDQVDGLDHLNGEVVSVYFDGEWDAVEVVDGSAVVSGCVMRFGFEYESTARLLPYRQNLGTTDGANDPTGVKEIAMFLLHATDLSVGSGVANEFQEVARSYEGVIPDEAPDSGFDGWAEAIPVSTLNDNEVFNVSIRARGPWPCIVRNVEAIVESSGGR